MRCMDEKIREWYEYLPSTQFANLIDLFLSPLLYNVILFRFLYPSGPPNPQGGELRSVQFTMAAVRKT